VTRLINTANATRIQPSADLEISSGKMGDVQDSTVANSSIVEKAFGIDAMHTADTAITKATDDTDGLVSTDIDRGGSPLVCAHWVGGHLFFCRYVLSTRVRK